jgi:hypothetical protein
MLPRTQSGRQDWANFRQLGDCLLWAVFLIPEVACVENIAFFHPSNFTIHFIGFYWILLDFIGFYWILLDFIGFYWILLDFIGFYHHFLLF